MSKETSSIPRNTPKLETGKPASKHETLVKETDDKDAEFRSTITSFCQQSVKDQEENRAAISELRSAIASLSKQPPQETSFTLDEMESPNEDRSKGNQRSTIYFGQSSTTLRTILNHQREAISIPTTSYPSTPNRHRLRQGIESRLSRRTSIPRKTDSATCIKISRA